MNDATNRKPMWLRIAQFPPLRLAVFGAVMLYMLGTSNKFIGETAGNPLLQIAVITGWSTVAFTVYRLFRKWGAGKGDGYPRRKVVSVS